MNWKQELGGQIKKARKLAGMTQDELAARLDVSRQMVSRYEAGQDAPAVEVLAQAGLTLATDFVVGGIRITCEQISGRLAPRLLPKQLQFEFEKSRRFPNAVVVITPHEGRILIKAEI